MDTPLTGESESNSPNPEAQSKIAENTDKRPLNIIPHKWKPGVSPNPGGRPKKLPITEAYRAVLKKRARDVNPSMLERLQDAGFQISDEATMDEVLATMQVMEALNGKTRAATEITDRVEGKAIQRVEVTGAEGGPVETVDLSRLTNDDDLREYTRLQAIVTVPESGEKAE